ncbi:MAG: hypothetical protein FJ014_18105 [Chloroflexi bacterium]|nr:hypothetical protein [Chloroflexota bacterium]
MNKRQTLIGLAVVLALVAVAVFVAGCERPEVQAVRERACIYAKCDSYIALGADILWYSDDRSTLKAAVYGDSGQVYSANTIVLEGSTADAHETTLTVTDPTADRTITLPNNSGTVVIAPTAATNYGAVFAAVNTVAYTDTSNKTMFVIPANADIVDIMLVVTTAFNDTGTDLLNCGYTAGSPNEYIANGVVSAVGVQRMGADATMPYAKVGDVGSSNVTVLCKYTGQNGNSSAGAATVQILYRID